MLDFIDSYRKYKIGDKIGEFEITDIWDFKEGYKDYLKDNFIFIHLDNKHWFCLRPSGTEPLLRIYYDIVDIEPKDLTNLISKK
jgi:phosphomannomutase